MANQPSPNRPAWWLVVVLGLIACWIAPADAQQRQQSEEQQHSLYYGVHLPDDRKLSRNLDLATELIEEGRYSEATPLLLDILSHPEDRAYGVRSEARLEFESLQSKASKAVEQLSDKGRQSYQLASEAAARRELRQAVVSSSSAGLASIVRRYPDSAFSAAAAWQLARLAADESNYEQAIAWLNILRSQDRYVTEFEPQATVMTGVCLARLGSLSEAEQVLIDSGLSQETVDQIIAGGAASPRADESWLGRGGDRRRSRAVSGGRPHLWARWQTRIASTLPRQQLSDELAMARRREGRPTIPAGTLVAVGDNVVMRTQGRVVAIDWRTGRRQWQTRPIPITKKQRGELRHLLQQAGEPAEDSKSIVALDWLDQVNQSLSSDGQHVFAIDGNYTGPRRTYRAWQFPIRGGNRIANSAQPVTNKLSAYSSQLQGKLAWSIDGAAKKGAWTGVYFLGAPLAIDGRLLLVFQWEQTIFLAEVAPHTGDLIWKQPLVTVESDIGSNAVRRLTGACVASGNEVAVCSTGLGAVVAVDLAQRHLKWVCRLPVAPGKRPMSRAFRNRRHESTQSNSSLHRWLENQVMIVGQRVLVASPESDRLHCIDLNNGELAWSFPRGDGLFLAGSHGGLAVVLSPHSALAIDMDKGKRVWRIPLPSDATVVGRGMLVDEELFVPLDDGNLFTVNLTDRSARSLSAWDGELGNLIHHRGSIISQSRRLVDRFDQAPGAIESAEHPLEESGDNALDRVALSELALAEGDLESAKRLLLQAGSTSVNQPLVSDRLRKVLWAIARTRSLEQVEIERMLELSLQDTQRYEVLALAARSAAERGDYTSVIQYALAAGSIRLDKEPLAPVSEGYWAKPTRQIAGAMDTAWKLMSEAERQSFSQQLLGDANAAVMTGTALQRRARLFAAIPAAENPRPELAERWGGLEGKDAESDELTRQLADRTAGSTHSNLSPWSFRQARTTRNPRRAGTSQGRSSSSRGRQVGFVELPVVWAGERSSQLDDSATRYAITMNGLQLRGWDKNGVSRFRVDIPQVGSGLVRSLRSSLSATDQVRRLRSKPVAWRVGGLLILGGGGAVIGIDTLSAERGEEAVRWTTRERLQAAGEQLRGQELHYVRKEAAGAKGSLASSSKGKQRRLTLEGRWDLLGVSPTGVLVRSAGVLACLDPRTGEPLWIRSDLEIGTKPLMVGRDYAYARLRQGDARIRLLDGAYDDQWRGPEGDWISLRNGCFTSLNRDRKAMEITITDLSSGQLLIKEKFDDAIIAPVRFSDEIVFVEKKDGRAKLTSIDLAQGRVVLNALLEAPAKKGQASITAQRRPFGLVVTLGVKASRGPRPVGVSPVESGPLLTGKIVCLRSADGHVAWQADCTDYELIGRTPPDSPLILLGRRDHRQTASGVDVTSQLVALDGETGRSVGRINDLPGNAVKAFRVRYESGPQPALHVLFQKTVVEVRVTDAPLPPGPAYNSSVESPAQVSLSDWWGMGKRIGEKVRDSIRPKPDDEED